MKVIYTPKEKEILKLQKIIQTFAWGIQGYEHYNIGYSPFHSELARILYEKGYRNPTHRRQGK